jgi:purine-nucleoside phosphorylase
MSVKEYLNQIEDSTHYIKNKSKIKPEIGIILGTGLGGLAKEISLETSLSYKDIPNFPVSTVETHEGKLLLGELGNKSVIAMQGRFHYYEGYSMKQITLPVRVMKKLGIHSLLISNASGGMNPLFKRGDLMLIEDHINLLGDNPLIGPNLDEFGPRFPDMSQPYSMKLNKLAEQIALEQQIKLQKGIFVAVSGPNLETRAEYRFLRMIGADAVGMSTVPENIVAVHSGLDVLGISVITDECFPDALKPIDINEVFKTANTAEPKLTLIMKKVIEEL